MLVVQVGGDGREVREFEGGIELDDFEQETGVHYQRHVNGSPLMIADLSLLQEQGSALIELAKNTESIVNVFETLAIEACDALLGNIDPELAGHCLEDLGFEVLGVKAWIGSEGKAIAGALLGLHDACVLIAKGFGQGADDFSDALGIALFTLLAMVLQAGVIEERLQAGILFQLSLGVEWGVIDGDQASYVTVFGLDDELGGDQAGACLAYSVLHGVSEALVEAFCGFELSVQDALDEALCLFAGEAGWSGSDFFGLYRFRTCIRRGEKSERCKLKEQQEANHTEPMRGALTCCRIFRDGIAGGRRRWLA